MADTKNANETRKPTEKDAQFFFAILSNMKNKPEVDWDIVAARTGYNNGNTAKTRFGQIKRQLGANEDGTLGNDPSPVKPRGARAKKEKPVGSGTNTTPSKVTKKKSASPAKPKIPKGELANLQASSGEFLSGSASSGGAVKREAGNHSVKNEGLNGFEDDHSVNEEGLNGFEGGISGTDDYAVDGMNDIDSYYGGGEEEMIEI